VVVQVARTLKSVGGTMAAIQIFQVVVVQQSEITRVGKSSISKHNFTNCWLLQLTAVN
jgi:hypothetical protein